MITYKVSQSLQPQLTRDAASETIGVIVRHRAGTVGAHAVMRGAQAISRQLRLVSATVMQVRIEDIDALTHDDAVEYIWPDLPVHTYLSASTGRIQAPAVWATGLTGSGVKIAILDTGIDPDHPDFAGRVKGMSSFVGGTGQDDNGHGTHVAGIVAGSGVASEGRYRGVAPGASLYIGKVLDSRGGGLMSSVMAGIEWAVEQGAQVINLSLGGPEATDGDDALSVLCDQVVRQLGIVVSTAAGNLGPSGFTIGAPGCGRWVTTVGASDENDHVAGFSSRGPTEDGRVKPDIVFPGTNIVSAQAQGTAAGLVVEPGYVRMSGTSMAAPHASGSAALLLEARPDLRPHEVKRALQSTAVLIANESPNAQGSGRGDVFAAYERLPQVVAVRSLSAGTGDTPGDDGGGGVSGWLRRLGLFGG
jgi:subtilisin family serine protease